MKTRIDHAARTWIAIVAQAEREFPYECCGFIIGDGNAVEEVRPIANIQNAHACEGSERRSRATRAPHS